MCDDVETGATSDGCTVRKNIKDRLTAKRERLIRDLEQLNTFLDTLEKNPELIEFAETASRY